MHAHATGPSGALSGTIVPTLRYRDVAGAIDWLCNAFGFERHLVVPGENGTVRYAELTFGDGMIMLGPVAESAFDGLMTQPADTGGAETQICYLFVEDAATHCAQARAAGAEIVLDIEEDGGRGYSCRDPEGHIWNFGTYDPWRRQARAPEDEGSEGTRRARTGLLGKRVMRAAFASCLILGVAASAGAVGWTIGGGGPLGWDWETLVADRATDTAREQLARARSEREAAEEAMKEVRAQLAQERRAREAAERTAKEAERAAREAAREAREQAAREAAKAGPDGAGREARELSERLSQADRSLAALKNELAAERAAREAADRATYQVREQLAQERRAREAAERSFKEAAENAAKEAAENAAKEARERKERAAAAKKPPPQRRAYSAPQPKAPPSINWFGG